jgi:hypothetical protein
VVEVTASAPAVRLGSELLLKLCEAPGVTKQRLLQLTERTDFPAPMVRLAAGPVWLAASVRAFDRHWTRKPGRPAKAEPNQPSNMHRVVRNARGGSISNKNAVKRNSQRD